AGILGESPGSGAVRVRHRRRLLGLPQAGNADRIRQPGALYMTSDKAARFRALHRGPGAFLIPNPWDAGSARILAGLGFEALATSSAAAAGTLGRRDGKINREEALAHARSIAAATDLAVSADLEQGFGDAPAFVAETVRLAADDGLVGCSIEDFTGEKTKPFYAILL